MPIMPVIDLYLSSNICMYVCIINLLYKKATGTLKSPFLTLMIDIISSPEQIEGIF